MLLEMVVCPALAVYALEQLCVEWSNSTPDMQHNLAGWNGLVDTYPPCAQTSPWRGVFCNAKPQSQYGRDVWDFEIVGLYGLLELCF